MKIRSLPWFVVTLGLLLSVVSGAAAQGIRPPDAQPAAAAAATGGALRQTAPLPGRAYAEEAAAVAAAPAEAPSGPEAIALGQPGLSFRYVKTLGQTETAYLQDNNHFYDVEGVGAAGAGVWIADSWGLRALRFAADGTFQQQIGGPGFRRASGAALDYVADIAVDGSGNTWVVDPGADHVVKYNAAGQYVNQIGGEWSPGSANGRFNDPISIAFDANGNIYVSDSGLWGADYGNQRVQVFDGSGNWLANIGQTGVAGSGNNQLHWPRHIAVYGNALYVADAGNQRVQIFNITNPASPTWTATLGVTGVAANDNSHFNSPEGVGVDANYIYVADANNGRVQVFNRATLAYVATIGSGGYGTDNSHFNHPSDVAIDTAGNIYVADNWNKRVQQYNSSRVYQRTLGTTGVSYVTDPHHYYFPVGVAAARDGSLYIAEQRGHRLVKLDANGALVWAVGQPGQAGDDVNHFCGPQDVAVDAQGRAYVVENWCNSRVKIYDTNGTLQSTLGGSYGSGEYEFENPQGIAVDANGKIYVADVNNYRVQIFDSALVHVGTLGQTGVQGSGNNQFSRPLDVAVAPNGTIYVADQGSNHRVQVYDVNLNYVRTIGGGGTGNDFGHFADWGPNMLAVDASNRLYVTDAGNNRVQVFDASGAYLTSVGWNWGPGTSDLRGPMGVAVGPDGTLYVADLDNDRVQVFAPGTPNWLQVNINAFGDRSNGNLHTLAGFGGQLYAGTYNTASGGQVWRMGAGHNWTQPVAPGFGIVSNRGVNHLLEFDGKLYAGVRNDTLGARVYRSADGSSWEPVVTSGLDDPHNAAVYRMEVFNNQIYAATGIFTMTHGAEVWRSPSGDAGSWTPVETNGFGDVGNYIVRSSAVFNGSLYFGTDNWNSTTQATAGGAIFRSDTGAAGSWRQVNAGGFGDLNNEVVSSLAAFDGYLYASTAYRANGDQVWRCQACDGSDWTKVVDNGFGTPGDYLISSLQVLGNNLYVAVGNPLTGLEVWRSSTGNPGDWARVGAAGFGDVNNGTPYHNNFVAFNGGLYVGMQSAGPGPAVWEYLSKSTFLPMLRR